MRGRPVIMSLVLLARCLTLQTCAAVQQTPSTAGRGFGAVPTSKKEKAVSKVQDGLNTAGTTNAAFEEWAKKSGIEKFEPMEIHEFPDTGRGVRATTEIVPSARIVKVPSRLALQVNSLTKSPAWCDEACWKAAKWDARLAMMLLREEQDARSDLKPWLAQLPRSFNTPVLWSDAAAAFGVVSYPALSAAVAAQRAEWDAARAKAPGAPSKEKWDWAMNVARSRAFSGPYTPSTFVGSLSTLFGASTLALVYALVVGGAGAADQAFDGFLAAVVFILCNDFLIGPRFSSAKRHVLCPWIDLLNHDGNLGKSEIAYEYFSDAFAARLDPDGGAVAAGSEVLISYGPRTNDVLLQYYGFVQPNNPFDIFAVQQEMLILDLNAHRTLSAEALPALAKAGLTDPTAFHALSADGAGESTSRLARLVLHPAAASQADEGKQPLSPTAEADVHRALAAVADARLAAMLLPEQVAAAALAEDVPRELMTAFIAEKRRVLEASSRALRRKASGVGA